MEMLIHGFLYFLSGMILVNGTPHLINGLSGRYWPKRSKLISKAEESFQKKKMICSPVANFIWGFINITIALLIILGIGNFRFSISFELCCLLSGILIGGIYIAWNFNE
jgi:hypothetical protein